MNKGLKLKFELGKDKETFLLVNEEPGIDIFVGYQDGRPTMVIDGRGNEKKVESTQYIYTQLLKNNNRDLRLVFSLMDLSMYDIFLKFCYDIIERTKQIDKNKCINYVLDLWDDWRLVFKKISSNLLDENEIIGLLGELVFLREYLIPKFGEEVAIKSWGGFEKLHKDFEIENTWYEVKSVQSSALTIKINSVEQLESDILGHIVIINLDKTSVGNPNSININNYIYNLENEIKDFSNRNRFLSNLKQMGYFYDSIYEEYNFKVNMKRIYRVDNDFPKIDRETLKYGIVKLSYEISIDAIEKYLEERI